MRNPIAKNKILHLFPLFSHQPTRQQFKKKKIFITIRIQKTKEKKTMSESSINRKAKQKPHHFQGNKKKYTKKKYNF